MMSLTTQRAKASPIPKPDFSPALAAAKRSKTASRATAAMPQPSSDTVMPGLAVRDPRLRRRCAWRPRRAGWRCRSGSRPPAASSCDRQGSRRAPRPARAQGQSGGGRPHGSQSPRRRLAGSADGATGRRSSASSPHSDRATRNRSSTPRLRRGRAGGSSSDERASILGDGGRRAAPGRTRRGSRSAGCAARG